MDTFDCLVIGTGAAGVSAALTLKSLGLSFGLIGNPSLSLKIRRAEMIKNYPGLPSVTGEQLCGAFLRQLEEEEIEIIKGSVTGVYGSGGDFTVTCQSEVYKSRTIILAGGVQTAKPAVNEREFLGKGVSYCASCDAFLYRGKTVAAFASSAEEEEEVALLARYAAKVCYFPAYANVGELPQNVEIMRGSLKEVCGGDRVERIVTDKGELEIDGVFILKDAAAETLIDGLAMNSGSVEVDRACGTNIAGVFAAGDCTGRPYQYAKAVGEGNVAAHSVKNYLVALKKAER